MICSFLKRVHRRFLLRRDPIRYARSQGVEVGENCRLLGLRPGTFGSEPYLVSLGTHVTITGGVQFVTHDGGVWVLRPDHPEIDVFGPISIGDNVFIGFGSLILPGVTIGNNVVVGAGSVVNRNIPSDSVAAGVPARVLGTLLDYETRSLSRAVFIRSMDKATKRAFLEKHVARRPTGA